jgi:hypothetical protein
MPDLRFEGIDSALDRLAKYPRCVLVNPKYRPVVDSVRMVRKALKDDRCVTLTMYPEGMMPFTGAQMPLITKEGAHVIARKLALELSGSDTTVLIIETHSNMLSHLTEREVFQPILTISSIKVVPATPFDKGGTDEWSSQGRRETERRVNADRGVRMLNILCAKPLLGSMTYAAEPFGVLKARECVE